MSSGFHYNLDTIKILSDKNVPFVLSDPVNAPDDRGIYDEGYRNPQIVYYQGKPTNIVILPVSYPSSSSLSPDVDNSLTFSLWQDTVTRLSDNNEMILFLFRSSDLGDPAYSSRFIDLFSKAKTDGYTFTTPGIVADHYRTLQNIQYSGFTDIDTASLSITNNNSVTVRKVTFKITLDNLSSGNYTTNQGRIVRIVKENNSQQIYVSTDIPAHTTQNLVVKPDISRKTLYVHFPEQLTEGMLQFTVTDVNGKPLEDAVVSIDTTFYRTDADGNILANMHRGAHKMTIQSPGYEKINTAFVVKGRIVNLQNMFTNIFRSSTNTTVS
jgi:hypothetical protein